MCRYLEGYSELDCKLIYLKFFENYSYPEIAEIPHMKKSNVHRRGSKIIKEILKKEKKERIKNDNRSYWRIINCLIYYSP